MFVNHGEDTLIKECFLSEMITSTGTRSFIGMIQGLEQSLASIAHAAVMQIIRQVIRKDLIEQCNQYLFAKNIKKNGIQATVSERYVDSLYALAGDFTSDDGNINFCMKKTARFLKQEIDLQMIDMKSLLELCYSLTGFKVNWRKTVISSTQFEMNQIFYFCNKNFNFSTQPEFYKFSLLSPSVIQKTTL